MSYSKYEKLILEKGANYVLSIHELVKREVGVNPTRSRRCKRRVLVKCHWETGKATRAITLEPEDLPISEYHKLYER